MMYIAWLWAFPGILARGQSGGARAIREMVGRAVGQPGRRQVDREAPGQKKFQKPVFFTCFLRHPCDSHTVLKLKIRNSERGLQKMKKMTPLRILRILGILRILTADCISEPTNSHAPESG